MSNSPLVSVIVPVYKVERYLPRCIESILRQTYTNFELILVDDGTPDRSGIICDRYAEKDSRIKVIHKENGGVSSARNAGIDAAQGEWITFVDSDDWVAENYIEAMIIPVVEKNVDFVVASIEIRKIKRIGSCLSERFISKEERGSYEILKLLTKPRLHGPFAKIYKNEIIRTNNIQFPTGIKDGEDKVFVAEYLKFCNQIQTINDIVYYYNRLNEYSATQRFGNESVLPLWICEYVKAFSLMCDAYKANNEDKKCILSQIAYEHMYSHMRNCAKFLKKETAETEIKNTSRILMPWVELDTTWIANFEESSVIYEMIISNNISGIYKTCGKHKQLRKLKGKLRSIANKTLGPLVEKYRDGLK